MSGLFRAQGIQNGEESCESEAWPFAEGFGGWTEQSRSYTQRLRSSVGGGRRKRDKISNGLVLRPMSHHTQFFISDFDRDREETSNNSADDTNRKND